MDFIFIFLQLVRMLFSFDKHLRLNNMVYTMYVTKHLLYVSHFSKDIHVYFEFRATHCLVKDSNSNCVMLRGLESGGLYRLDLSCFPSTRQNITMSAVISPHMCLSLADQTKNCCNNVVMNSETLMNSETTFLQLYDNAYVDDNVSLDIDDIQ